ncbi:MAG TPA: endonuclease/exonuclease/phosphatase family protein [Baekduia sp.]|uniref:endonuclease/exonuclease/phosphatase family protein n=1 Tax=Baekduia sp. TaxID=2600305 RepID=UPI002D78E183|nr:endonuclease/exonuclease/phosphatase family protein [Baekduia sp.]HET6509813.1 endonuclease/exonuclease/phosphatase family protein [Baekduia sp.]
MRVVTWNLFHGRSVPDTSRSLLREFTDMLAGWAWDVALLQEVPPWWPASLADGCGAEERHVLTSRNALLPARRWVADRRPDLVKSNGGGANAILVRDGGDGGGAVRAHAARRVRTWPERRVAHAVALADGTWVGNVHATTHPDARTRADLARAGAALAGWAGGAPALLGGDMNIAAPRVPGWDDLGGHGIDRFLAQGLSAVAAPVTLDTQGLSDHAPVAVEVVRSQA